MSEYGKAEFMRDTGASAEASNRLELHREMIREAPMNLMGPKELDLYWQRHALDSAQLVKHAPDAKRWIDLGAGAGFPGIVLAALLADVPGAEIHMIESTGKKASFLRETIERLGLNAHVFNMRIEEFGAGEGRYDVVCARALAPLPRLIEHAKPFLDRGAQGLFHKGANIDAELADARHALGGAYKVDVLESLSDPSGRIIRITKAAASSRS